MLEGRLGSWHFVGVVLPINPPTQDTYCKPTHGNSMIGTPQWCSDWNLEQLWGQVDVPQHFLECGNMNCPAGRPVSSGCAGGHWTVVLQGCLGRWVVPIDIHINPRIQGFNFIPFSHVRMGVWTCVCTCMPVWMRVCGRQIQRVCVRSIVCHVGMLHTETGGCKGGGRKWNRGTLFHWMIEMENYGDRYCIHEQENVQLFWLRSSNLGICCMYVSMLSCIILHLYVVPLPR